MCNLFFLLCSYTLVYYKFSCLRHCRFCAYLNPISGAISAPPANFAMTEEDEITEAGFLGLHEMAGRDEEGGEGELWQCLQAMGYNKQLQLRQVNT